ncbi:MAG: septum formation protein Maf [Planctomycetes bacterium]|nr:septum formation protein Maf [Planctomycetota bacterium]
MPATLTPTPPLILGSTSRYRRELLTRLGVPFTVEAPRCDEEVAKLEAPSRDPLALAAFLATTKAQSLAVVNPDSVIIGSDQVLALGDAVLGKSGDAAGATRQLTALSGREHRLITALTVVHGARSWSHADVTTMSMRTLSAEQIARYIAHDRPFDCAGSYKLESRGIALFERIQSEDQSAIVGLPLIALAKILIGIGYQIP